jgi:cupin fold WbuC family metalloprotein
MKSVLNALSRLLKPEGYLALEVPDFEKSLVNLDYPAIWEEHHAYFTENTFKSFLETNGLEMLYFKNHEYALENSLVSIVRKGKAKDLKQVVASRDLERELYLGRKFGQSFPSIKRKVQSLVSTTKGPVALMGAGHLGTAFINYFEIEDELSVVIDDDKNKRGLFMPGSGLEIKDSSHLDAANTCLLSINPRNLEGFFERHSDYINRGGKFYSIFKNSSAPLPVFYSPEELSLAKSSEEVYYAIKKSGTWELTREHADFLKSNLSKSKTGRIRICTHENPQSPLQEMIILFSGENYVRPHKHTNKSESFHMIEGSLAVLLFDNYGKLDKTVFLDATGKKGDLYYRLESPVYHTVIGLSNNWMIHETTNGPFDSSQTAYAPWAPQAGTNESTTYMKALRLLLEEQRHKA